jgi:hypothetical protein
MVPRCFYLTMAVIFGPTANRLLKQIRAVASADAGAGENLVRMK